MPAFVQGVGYPRSSRSHVRATEIWETGSVAPRAPEHGWLGRYLDHACECGDEPLAGVQFAESLGRTLASASDRSTSIGHPELLLGMDTVPTIADAARGTRPVRLDYLRQIDNDLAHAARQLHRARAGTGEDFDYPDTEFGQALRWTGDMIETGCPTRVYYVSIGSFDTPRPPLRSTRTSISSQSTASSSPSSDAACAPSPVICGGRDSSTAYSC